jgi:hypothetical protein
MKTTAKKSSEQAKDIKIEMWLHKNAAIVFYVLLGVFVLFSGLYFNARVSITGDDSTYITRAINFWDSGTYPSYQGPFYPMVLSLVVGLFGMKLLVLKVSSAIFMMVTLVLLYKTFKDKVLYTTLFFTLGVLSVSHYFLFFSSQTFSEPLFMLLQGAFFLYMCKNIEQEESKGWRLSKREGVQLGMLVLFGVLMFITRTVGFGAMLAALVYFLANKQFKRAVYLAVGFAVLIMLLVGIRSAVWDLPVKSGEQTSQLLNKHPYDSSQGGEDFSGFLQRFKDNSNLYLSKHFMRIIGFRSSEKNTINPLLTVALYLIFLLGVFWFFKRNKALFFTAVYLAIMFGVTFFSLQKLWDQYRLIIPFVPFVLLFLVSTIVRIVQVSKISLLMKLIPVFLCLSIVLTFEKGVKTIHISTLTKNLKGDKFAGFTPDWVSYLQMVDFVSKNLKEENTYVACRKPNIARIYGKGRKFYGIYRIPESSPEELLQLLKHKGVTHVMLASLRKNPNVFTGQTINTVRRYMYAITKKYPQTFRLIKQFGDKEPTYLFEIDYSMKNPIKGEIINKK